MSSNRNLVHSKNDIRLTSYSYRYRNAIAERQQPSSDENPYLCINEAASNCIVKSDFKRFYCKACEKSCISNNAYQAHLKSHVTCKFEGCNFSASQKVVSLHFSQEHGKFAGSGYKEVTVAVPGLKPQRFDICVGNRDEDIAAWIAERKKNWPSRANIAKREFEKKRILEEGGILNYQENKNNKSKSVTTNDLKGSHFNSIIQAEEKNTISSLVAGYGSSSDDENSDEEKKLQTKNNDLSQLKRNIEKEDCADLHNVEKSRNSRKKRKLGNQKRMKSKLHDRRNETLLQKLLTADIDRETSLTLQCIRFLVDCNLFQAK